MIKRNEAKILVPIISAYAEGRILQYKEEEGWRDIEDSEGLSINTIIKQAENYRIKPEPNYRPFANAEECWAEMQKHQPFGWLISQNGEVNSLIISIDNEGLIIGDRNNGVMGFVTATDLFKIKFADGTPFGVKVEE